MKKLYPFFVALMAFVFSQRVLGQQLLVQDFNFSGALTANGWTAHSSGGTNAISTTTGLTYAGYAGSGVGNAALVGNAGGEDDNITFANQTTNGQSIYFAFMVNVNEASTSKSGDYFFHTGSPGGATWSTFAGRVFARVVGGVVNFGVSNSTTPTYGTTNFARNTTYLLVMKYTITTGAGNDALSLWVLPSGVPASEAAAGTPELTNTGTPGTDAINAVGLRQGSTSQPQTVVDGIRVGNTWTDALQTGAAANGITTGAVSTAPFCVDASTTATGTVAFTATGTYNTTFTAYLSDASGNFTTPVSIGSTTVTGTDPSGSINITIPAGTASGTGYKIRVDATTPAVTGSTSAAFEVVNGAKNVTGATAAGGNTQASVSWINPGGCFDEVMIVAKAAASVTATPTGNGSAYTASATFGNGTPFDGGYVVYKGTSSPQTITALTNGTVYYFKIFTRKGTAWSSGVEVTATPNASTQPGPGDIVINQLSPDYNSATDEYIELINKTNSNIDLSGYAIKYQSAAGSTGAAGGTLSGTLLARHYWLLSPNATVTVGLTNGLARDGAIASGMAFPNGQVALVRLSDNTIIDAVGYGTITGGNYTEGTAAPAPPTDGGIKRTPTGTDTNNNSADFTTVANANILLRNSAAEAPLAVKLTNFNAVPKGTDVYIAWSNLTESGIKDYTVERSVNGTDFIQLITIKPTGNQGNEARYSAVDASPVKGINFYRIRVVEISGRTIFSNVLKLNTSNLAPGLLVYPNPVKANEGLVQLSNIPAGQYRVQVRSFDGRIVSSKLVWLNQGSSTETFPATNLPDGIYALQVSGPVNFQQLFVRQ